MNLRHSLAVVACATLIAASCGGGNDPVVAPDSPSKATADIQSDVPEALRPGVRPISVEGAALDALPETGEDPALGSAAPVLVGQDFDGRAVRLDPASDGPTWVIFLAHWCPHCNDEIPVINALRDEGRIPDGVNIVGVSTAANPTRPNFPPGEWLDDMDWTFGVVADGFDAERQRFIAAEAYGVSSFPFSVLVDETGAVVDRWSGGRTADELVARLANGLTGGS